MDASIKTSDDKKAFNNGWFKKSLENGGIGHPEETDEVSQLDSFADIYRNLILAAGEDPRRSGLLKTPMRAAKAFMYFTKGYDETLSEVIKGAIYEADTGNMVIVRDIEMFSMCEHHLLPFYGKVSIGYLPKKKIIGLSKLVRIVELFSRRMQVQEGLTNQIAEALMNAIDAASVGVVVEAKHMCMVMRGVQQSGINTITSCVLGEFQKDAHKRKEFMDLIK